MNRVLLSSSWCPLQGNVVNVSRMWESTCHVFTYIFIFCSTSAQTLLKITCPFARCGPCNIFQLSWAQRRYILWCWNMLPFVSGSCCHVSGTPWRIITGSRLDECIYWCWYYNYTWLQSPITGHNRWLPKARSVFFMDYERLLLHGGCLINSCCWLITL
jgi:hypothetical protein